MHEQVLVCVTQQKTCERLIRKAYEKLGKNGNLFVLHVAKNEWNILDNSKEGEALDYLFEITKSYGADMTVLRSDNIPETIANFALKHKITLILMGETQESHKENKFYKYLKKLLRKSNIEIEIIPSE